MQYRTAGAGRLDHLAAGEPLSSLGESFRVRTVLSGGSVAVSVPVSALRQPFSGYADSPNRSPVGQLTL
jgi:hypothetical protein